MCALLIANQRCNDALDSLKNPHWDIVGVAAVLKDRGFEVALLQDVSRGPMRRSVADYAAKFARAGEEAIGIFYYAGHRVAAGNTSVNYLPKARN